MYAENNDKVLFLGRRWVDNTMCDKDVPYVGDGGFVGIEAWRVNFLRLHHLPILITVSLDELIPRGFVVRETIEVHATVEVVRLGWTADHADLPVGPRSNLLAVGAEERLERVARCEPTNICFGRESNQTCDEHD